ncbi:TetR/AcrR family transcriptional regulator [uncultured Sulfitobacter sp.]|uniref:TetR/AcrR family transcriptional regulator n=1 Tax=uncultured Sulfitobacter sp. TaxID=191468 RepID=UPI0026051260|nr:TetR/AcrR family transcriptional regulator [uncultured Sulfitobacter sp.]
MSSKNNPTRDRILKSCQTLLETKGASDVRMSDIAKRAGISRQALYLHFPNRAELLIATTRYLDEIHGIGKVVDDQIFTAEGVARLEGFIDVWCNYIPKIYGVGKALMAIKDVDEEARVAWDDRMSAVRDLCDRTIQSLIEHDMLLPDLNAKEATDLLWTLVSVRNWEHLTQECGWSQVQYLKHMHRSALKLFTVESRDIERV